MVDQATCARDAIQLLDDGNIDLVLTDVAMERRDAGWELAERARERGIAVILVSGQRASAFLGRPLSVPLLRKGELARVSVTETIACALASQRGQVERIAPSPPTASSSAGRSGVAKTTRAFTSADPKYPLTSGEQVRKVPA